MNVFVSSPSDVYEEREILDGVVRDINNTWMDALGIMLKTKKWETNVPSKIINQDPTDIIIEEIGEYDIHIGICGVDLVLQLTNMNQELNKNLELH